VFLCEQLLYNPEDVKRHQEEGDDGYTVGMTLPPIPRHAYCKFCRRTLFSQEDLLVHMHKKHHICRLCEQTGRRGQFYRDVSHLSLHYEEQHYVCAHEDCKQGTYNLVAFKSQDDLQIHEVTQHRLSSSSGSCQKASQRAKKHGVRLQLQIGAASYRDEQEARLRCSDTSRGSGGRDRPAASQENTYVFFMWTRGKPVMSHKEGAARGKATDDASSNSDKEREECRYPARPQKCGPWARRRTTAASGSSAVSSRQDTAGNSCRSAAGDHVDQAVCPVDVPLVTSVSSVGDGTSKVANATELKSELSKEGTLDKCAAVVLAEALKKIMELGLHSTAEMDSEEHMERVGQFKNQLETSLGAAQFEESRCCLLVLQQSLTNVHPSVDAHDFTKRLVSIFCTAARESGDDVASATLLSELVLLVPDYALRCALHQHLVRLHGTESRAPAEQSCALQVASVPNRKGPFARRREAAAAKLKQREISMHDQP